MRQFLLVFPLIFTAVVMVACGGEKQDGSEFIVQGEMASVALQDTCSCDDLIEDENGNTFLDTAIYTGVCRLNYPNTEIQYMTKDYMNGQLHGEVTYFDREGNVLVEEIYVNGSKKRSGEGAPISCDCSELEQKMVVGESQPIFLLDGLPFTGVCNEKYPNSDQTYIEIHYDNGLRNGFATYFDKMGNSMFTEKYEDGVLVKTINAADK